MAWFWGAKKDDDDEEEEEEEYSEEEDADEDYSDSEFESESYEDEDDEEEEEEEQANNIQTNGDETKENGKYSTGDAAVDDAEHESGGEDNNNNNKPKPIVAASSTTQQDTNNDNQPSNNSTQALVSSYAREIEQEDDEDDEDDDNTDGGEAEEAEDLERIQAGVPDQVLGNRNRAPSALTIGETDDDDDEEEESNPSIGDLDESVHSEVSHEQDDHVTSLAEKQSLLVLAAEHDRVDILNSVLNDADEATKHELLHGGIPPLHIAVLNGSTNTATCLLRLGADPSIRPKVKEIAQNQDPQAPLDVPKQIDGVTAWELAFDKKVVPAAKKASMMNAFSAEALRCMGSDEGTRLQQLLDAGMPADMAVMGDKSLYDWAVELGAPQCEEVLRPAQAAKYGTDQEDSGAVVLPEGAPLSGGKSAVLDRPGSKETAEQLIRQLEELESLAKALSTCLDSLAEEVSVSHGLLLMGGGASALASHVRSLKSLKEQKMEELSRHQEAFENTQDELEYWVNQAGPKGQTIAAEEAPIPIGTRKRVPPPKFTSADEERAYCENLQQRIAATNEKIRKFRVSIADLSEENDRNMQEVEKRGLTGGINLVRGLKDEIREVEFALEETKVADAVYRSKIDKIQSILNNGGVNGSSDVQAEELSVADASKASTEHHFNHRVNGNGEATRGISMPAESDSFSDVASQQSGDEDMKPSERIATGHSTALTVRREGPGPGSFPLSLWQILLRIIGLRDGTQPPTPSPRRQNNSYGNQPAMIV